MTLNKTTLFTTSLLGTLAFAAVQAQTTPVQPQQSQQQSMKPKTSRMATQPMQSRQQSKPTFAQLDSNHDGKLSRSEIPHRMIALRVHFRQYDRDGNGSLSKKEYEAYVHPPRVRQ